MPPPLSQNTIERDRLRVSGLQSFQAGDVSGYEVGDGPLVLALHGWGGRPAQMTALARAIADRGRRVVVPELPGHAGGRPTDIRESAAAVSALIDSEGPPAAVIAHSFAALVTRLVFADRPSPELMVLMAPVLDVNDSLEVFSERLGLFSWTTRGLRSRLETWDPLLWSNVSNLLIDQFPGSSIHIFHDPADRDASFSNSAELTVRRPDTHMHMTPDVGHTRLLSEPEVLKLVVETISDRELVS